MAREKNPNLVTINPVITKEQQAFLRSEAKKSKGVSNQSIILREAIDDLMKKRKVK